MRVREEIVALGRVRLCCLIECVRIAGRCRIERVHLAAVYLLDLKKTNIIFGVISEVTFLLLAHSLSSHLGLILISRVRRTLSRRKVGNGEQGRMKVNVIGA